MSTSASHSPLNISERLGFKGPPVGNGLWESNSHLIDDIT